MMWIAPLGAMNFAGYELAKRAMQSAEVEGETKAESGTASSTAASKPTPAVKPSPALTAVQAAGEDGATQIADAVVAEIPTTSGAEPAEEQTSSDTIAPCGCRTGCVCTSCIDQIVVVSPLHRLRWRRTPNLQGQPSE